MLPSKKSFLATLVALTLAGCNSSGSDSDNSTQKPDVPDIPEAKAELTIGLLPDTQADGIKVAEHPMRAVLDKHLEQGVNIVIPVGDLTDKGTTTEWESWVGIAREYKAQGMEFLPLMGNHEDSYAYTTEWIDYMKEFIPEDAVHMPKREWLNYYVIRKNTLIIPLAYWNLPIAFPWIKDVVAEHRDNIEHVVIASHDGLVGAKYGETRELIVEGTEGGYRDDKLHSQWDQIRDFFYENDVVWVQGHEHLYQRSVIKAPVGTETQSWTPTGGNYRLPQYTQIVSGNASYKGYEFRYGERELVQNVVQMKMGTYDEGRDSYAYDVNAAQLAIKGDRIDYTAFSAPHTIKHNDDGAKELADPEWVLMDKFSRTNNRCEKIIYANSLPEDMRPVMEYTSSYRTNECVADDGSRVRVLAGENNTFNRVDSTERTLSWTEGYSKAQSQNELMRMAYQFLFQKHAAWTPNLNGDERIYPNEENENVTVRATTIDMKKLLSLSWSEATKETASDIAIISGTQNQSGIYQNAYGGEKDIQTEQGMPGSQPDGSAKAPHPLPSYATADWDLLKQSSDPYAFQFEVAPGVDLEKHQLAWKKGWGEWQTITSNECVFEGRFEEEYLDTPPNRAPGCHAEPLVGKDAAENNFWVVLHGDAEIALIK
ncbi:metallophosphoesterase family protein [Vibrio comitans]|uniref:Calcineurin-like phosphoesterase domain-containing protein n=1 Tax=Vibrio comitans NBRC 102076 TaxID=1219078 RepID=A0A4Y3ILW5_9VIBR|nr:metallophosphoesterase [Vibrio comitans]GEA60396.1 hypothetical protein VCO01S_15890 [Vibrio comitans NBRC 102076]